MKRQSMVESILGRLIADVEFRHGFLGAPAEVIQEHALELDDDLDALARMDPVFLAHGAPARHGARRPALPSREVRHLDEGRWLLSHRRVG